MKFNTRPACLNDMPSIYLMGIDVWGGGSSEEQYLHECRTSAKYQMGQWYCLEGNGRLVSSLIVYRNVFGIQERYAGFGSISTEPNHRGAGFASKLINDRIENLRSEGCAGIYLHSETDSSIYKRIGFRRLLSSDDSSLMFLGTDENEQSLLPAYF